MIVDKLQKMFSTHGWSSMTSPNLGMQPFTDGNRGLQQAERLLISRDSKQKKISKKESAHPRGQE